MHDANKGPCHRRGKKMHLFQLYLNWVSLRDRRRNVGFRVDEETRMLPKTSSFLSVFLQRSVNFEVVFVKIIPVLLRICIYLEL
jgi:hypothetical protein